MPTAAGVDWLSVFANNLTNLTTVNGGVLTSIGFSLLSVTALAQLVNMVVQWNTASMSFTLHTHPLQAGDVVKFLMRLVICCMLESYWVNPLPGASFGFNHLFSYLAQSMAQAFDQMALNNLISLLKDAADKTGQPAFTAPLEILCYVVVQIFLGLASGILFLINVSAYILYGVSALFGPVFIPLYMTNTFRGKFLHFIDTLLSFAMIRAVAAAFIFVWGGFMNTFLTQTFNGDYSMKMWLANLVPVVTMFIAFILNMLYIPSLTQAIFGGAAGMAGRAEKVAADLIKLAAAA
jgi:hypothetical protein